MAGSGGGSNRGGGWRGAELLLPEEEVGAAGVAVEVNPDAFSNGGPFLTRMNDPQLLPALRQIIDLLESSNARFVGMEQLDED